MGGAAAKAGGATGAGGPRAGTASPGERAQAAGNAAAPATRSRSRRRRVLWSGAEPEPDIGAKLPRTRAGVVFSAPLEDARRLLQDHWSGLCLDPSPYGTGLINATWSGTLRGARVIAQHVHPAFGPRVHEDIEAVTAHLASKGVLTPRLVRSDRGELCVVDAEGRSLRVMTFIEGSESHDRLDARPRVREAGRVVGRTHAALADLDRVYVHTRPGIHDVAFRRRGLEAALEAERGHRLFASVRELSRRLERHSPLLLPVDVTRARHAHGDLKSSNILFSPEGHGLCLVDLDTLAHMAWPFELGDAIRSWCNPRREDEPGAHVDVGLFEAALLGYAQGAEGLSLEPTELELLPRGVLTIACELALRFLTDALEERYFAFDAARFAARGEHNLARARGQLELAESLASALSELEAITERTLGGR